MKRKSTKVVKTEIKSPYFTRFIKGENINNEPSEEGINDASNRCITEVIIVHNDTLSEKRTGKISKYFKSTKKRFKKGVSKFSELEKSFTNNLSVDLEAATDSTTSEMNITSEKDLDFDNEQDSIFDNFKSSKLPSMEEAKKVASIVINYIPKFIPMLSPYNLVQETLYYDPWKLLIATIFLNRTRGSQALPLMWKFLEEYQTPQEAVLASVDTLADLLRPLGLQNIRAERIIRFSYTYLLNPNFKTPKQLFGMGKYAEDSWKLFCEKEDNWMEEYGLEPEDRILQLYVNWRRHQYKISKGLTSEEKILGEKEKEDSREESQNDSVELSILKKYENENYLSLQELNKLDIFL